MRTITGKLDTLTALADGLHARIVPAPAAVITMGPNAMGGAVAPLSSPRIARSPTCAPESDSANVPQVFAPILKLIAPDLVVPAILASVTAPFAIVGLG